MKNLIFTALALFFAQASFAAELILINKIDSPYTLYINGLKYEHKGSEFLVFKQIKETQLAFNIVIRSKKLVNVVENINIKPDMFYEYQLEWKGKKVELKQTNSGKLADIKMPTTNFEFFKFGIAKSISEYSNTTISQGTGASSMSIQKTPVTKVESDNNTSIESFTSTKEMNSQESSTEVRNIKTRKESDYASAEMDAPLNCKVAIDNKAYQQVLNEINETTTATAKLGTARRSLDGKCITVSQLTEILQALSLESDRIELARKAYLHLVDTENFEELKAGFETFAAFNAVAQYVEIKYGK